MSNNKQAIEDFFKANWGVLCKRMSRRVPSYADAEDIISSAFEKALRYGQHFDPDTQEMGAWFNTIANRCAIDWRKADRLGGMTTSIDEKNGGLVDDTSIPVRMSQQVAAEISRCKGKKHDILYRRFMLGLRNIDICNVLKLKEPAVSLTISRFQQSMKDKWGEVV